MVLRWILSNTRSSQSSLIYNPPKDPLKILYQDDDLLVLSKPSGLLSVTGKNPGLEDCLQARVLKEYPDARLIHRLDLDTSGVFLMALNKPAQANVNLQFEKRKTKKTYIARVWGHINDKEGHVDLPICVDWDNRPRQKICHEHGRPSQTDWEVLEHGKLPCGNDFTRVLLKPITGRSHQLRVHMKTLGHPILGDVFYAHKEAVEAAKRLQLHAQSLTIFHPASKEAVTFTDPAPF